MTTVDPNKSLLELDGEVFSRLTDILDENNSWLTLAQFSKMFEKKQLSALSQSKNPSATLLHEMGYKLCEVRHLWLMLRECQLYDALSIIAGPEPLKIIKQPTDILKGREVLNVKIGNEFSLEFVVQGIPRPVFEWFKDNVIIKGQHTSLLHYEKFESNMQGVYTCKATIYINGKKSEEVNSNSITVELWAEAPIVIKQTDPCISFPEGSPLILKVIAKGNPDPKYEWIFENQVLRGANRNYFTIPKSTKDHSGLYKCYVKNKAGERIVPIQVYIIEERPVYSGPITQKLALLIANSEYNNFDDLNTPMNDVRDIALKLEELGFNTISVVNLTLKQMETALKLFAKTIEANAYIVVFYAGHGFKCGDSYLLPVDSPGVEKYSTKDGISESQILHYVMEKVPALCLLFLDMCLKLHKEDGKEEINTSYTYKSNRNLIVAYSTTSHKAAYETEKQNNSIYVNVLKKSLNQNIPVSCILDKVKRDVEKICPDQMPNVSDNTTKNFFLHKEAEKNKDANELYKDLMNDESLRNFLMNTYTSTLP